MNNYPKVYYQIKKIKEFWEKSKSSQKKEMIKLFEETLKEIELSIEFE